MIKCRRRPAHLEYDEPGPRTDAVASTSSPEDVGNDDDGVVGGPWVGTRERGRGEAEGRHVELRRVLGG